MPRSDIYQFLIALVFELDIDRTAHDGINVHVDAGLLRAVFMVGDQRYNAAIVLYRGHLAQEPGLVGGGEQ